MKPGEAALTEFNYGCSAEVSYIRNQGEGADRVTIQSVQMNISLSITIWLPKKTTQKLNNHEEGHKQIGQTIYNNSAQQAARQAAEPLVGKVIDVAGMSDEAIQRVVNDHVQPAGLAKRTIASPITGATESTNKPPSNVPLNRPNKAGCLLFDQPESELLTIEIDRPLKPSAHRFPAAQQRAVDAKHPPIGGRQFQDSPISQRQTVLGHKTHAPTADIARKQRAGFQRFVHKQPQCRLDAVSLACRGPQVVPARLAGLQRRKDEFQFGRPLWFHINVGTSHRIHQDH
jgi:hypothetical protein